MPLEQLNQFKIRNQQYPLLYSLTDSSSPKFEFLSQISKLTNSGTIETRTELAPKSLEIARNISTEIFVNSLLYYIKLGTIV